MLRARSKRGACCRQMRVLLCACRAREYSNGGGSNGDSDRTRTRTRTCCRIIRARGRALRAFAPQARLVLAHQLRWRGLRAAEAERRRRRLGAATRSPEHKGWVIGRGRLRPPSAEVERSPSLEGDHAQGGASIVAAGRLRAGLRVCLIFEKVPRKLIWLLSDATFLLLKLVLKLVLFRPVCLCVCAACVACEALCGGQRRKVLVLSTDSAKRPSCRAAAGRGHLGRM